MTNLVKAIAAAGPTAEKLARQWLEDDSAYVKPQAGRRGMVVPFAGVPDEQAAFAAVGVRSLNEADKRVYDYLSQASHGRRSSMLESYYVATRHMARASRYALLDQAKAVEWASATTSGVVLTASAMLLPFRGQEHIEREVLPLYASINAIREDQTLDSEKVAAELGIPRYPYWEASQQ